MVRERLREGAAEDCRKELHPCASSLLAGIDLFGPARVLDYLDEVDVAVAGNEVLENIGVDGAEGAVRAMLEAVGEGLKDLPFEVGPRVRPGDLRDEFFG